LFKDGVDITIVIISVKYVDETYMPKPVGCA